MPRNHEFDSARHANDLLGSRSEEEQRRIIYAMSAYDALMYDADFEAWAHESQLPPGREGWRVWLMMAAGSGRRGRAPSGSTGSQPGGRASGSRSSERPSTRPGES